MQDLSNYRKIYRMHDMNFHFFTNSFMRRSDLV